jgi:hypothetical protein
MLLNDFLKEGDKVGLLRDFFRHINEDRRIPGRRQILPSHRQNQNPNVIPIIFFPIQQSPRASL